MKKILIRLIFCTLIVSTAASCTTAYDAYGRPQQVVTPGGALLGAAAVGLLAYGLSNNGGNNRHRNNNCNYQQSYGGYSRHNRGYGGFNRGCAY